MLPLTLRKCKTKKSPNINPLASDIMTAVKPRPKPKPKKKAPAPSDSEATGVAQVALREDENVTFKL